MTGSPRVLAVRMGLSTIIGGEDEGHIQHTCVLLGVEVRDAGSQRRMTGAARTVR